MLSEQVVFDEPAFVAEHREAWEAEVIKYVAGSFREMREASRQGEIVMPFDRLARWNMALTIESAYRRKFGSEIDRGACRRIAALFTDPAIKAFRKEQAQ